VPLPDLCLFFHGLIQDCGHIMLCDMDLAHTSDDIAAAAAVVDTRACAGSVLSGGAGHGRMNNAAPVVAVAACAAMHRARNATVFVSLCVCVF
jgi:hypothetical protein